MKFLIPSGRRQYSPLIRSRLRGFATVEIISPASDGGGCVPVPDGGSAASAVAIVLAALGIRRRRHD